jgi:hypothetical protein
MWNLFVCLETKLVNVLAGMERREMSISIHTLLHFSSVLKVSINFIWYIKKISMCFIVVIDWAQNLFFTNKAAKLPCDRQQLSVWLKTQPNKKKGKSNISCSTQVLNDFCLI